MMTFTREQLATLREAAQNYQSMLAWYQEKPDSPNAEQDCDAALAAFKREIRHREVDIIAYLLDELEAAKSKLNEQREYYEGVIAVGSKRIAELEKSEEQLINERDHAESALADMYFAATGDRPEWSNWFGFSDAVDAVVDRIADLEAKQPVPVVPAVLERLRTIVADPRALPRRKEWVSGQQYSYVLLENVEAMVDEACHAASRMQQLDGWEAVAVAWKVTFTQVDHESNTFTAIYFDKAEVEYWVRLHKACGFRVGITPLYAAPPVPDKLPRE